MDIGFTGSRHGMQPMQIAKVQALFLIYWTYWPTLNDNTLHHGDCAGSDEQAFKLAKRIGFATAAYPASDVSEIWHANTDSDLRFDAAPALKRNLRIVSQSNVLVAAVHGFNPSKMQERSGTWATIRYAKKEGVPYWLVDPMGQAQFFPTPEIQQAVGISSLNWES